MKRHAAQQLVQRAVPISLSFALILPGVAAVAQEPQVTAAAETVAGSEIEAYLRSLQALGGITAAPWSLRPFSPVQLDALAAGDTGHPWLERMTFEPWRGLLLIRPAVGTQFNSAFPYGSNDGALWAGRGLTAWVQVGGAARWGPVTMRFEPVLYWAQNQGFELLDNGREGRLQFADGLHPEGVDRPQRFGDGSFARTDLGNSEIRVDLWGASIGLSNAHQWWGPTQHYPFLIGNNAPGFPHVFAGTSRPVDLWLAHLHTRVLWGRLAQSDYFDPPADIGRPTRFGTGVAAVIQPRGLRTLEIGGARFIHAPWPDEGIPGRYLTRSFEGLLKSRLPVVDPSIDGDDRSIDGENQLASVFARLTLPGAGMEVYTEFGREDHSWDGRDLLLLPDWLSTLTVGFRRSWRDKSGTMWVARGESINLQLNSASRIRETRNGSVYVHYSGANQGHTNRGQLLGADVGVGSAAGATFGIDRFDSRGRWTIDWQRIVRQERRELTVDGSADRRALDVLHALSVERLLFRGGVEMRGAVSAMHNFSRNFDQDRSGLSLLLSVTGLPR